MSEQDKTTMSAEEVLQKFDKESDKRNLTGMWDKLISFICIAFAVFQLYTATFGVLDAHLQRAIHLAFGFSLIYLLYPGRKNWSRSVMHPLDVISKCCQCTLYRNFLRRTCFKSRYEY